jgi:hypothetical protein
MKKIITCLLLTHFLLLQSCNKFVSQDDINPNEPSTATLQTLLPVIEVAIFATYTGSIARNTSMFVQHSAGISNQSLDYGQYIITETDIQNDWTTIYNAGIVNTLDLEQRASAANPYYVALAKIQRAMLLGIATDLWGDVPNREAGQGIRNLSPRFDTQETVLQDVQSLLSEGITLLAKPAAANAILPGADDYIHGGNPAKWTKTAWILKARYANRLSRRDPVGSANLALTFIDNANLTGNADDTNASFTSKGNELNQWYAFNFQRANYMKLSATLVNTLKSSNDPRLAIYATRDAAGDYSGVPLGSQSSQTSNIGAYFASPASSLPLVTYVEAKFIEAEAALRINNATRAQSAYATALAAALNRYAPEINAAGVTAYLAANSTLTGTASEKLATIMTQKWIAMFTQPEAWADWRRTNLPALSPVPNGATQPLQIPRRYPTEQRERINNPNSTVVSDLITPVWWDRP